MRQRKPEFHTVRGIVSQTQTVGGFHKVQRAYSRQRIQFFNPCWSVLGVKNFFVTQQGAMVRVFLVWRKLSHHEIASVPEFLIRSVWTHRARARQGVCNKRSLEWGSPGTGQNLGATYPCLTTSALVGPVAFAIQTPGYTGRTDTMDLGRCSRQKSSLRLISRNASNAARTAGATGFENEASGKGWFAF